MIRTPLCEKLGIGMPIVQAPMGGGPTTPQLVAAVCEAGALGSIAGGYLSSRQLADQIAAVRARTDRPFAVNVFAPADPLEIDPNDIERVVGHLAPLYAELGLTASSDRAVSTTTIFEKQLDVLLSARPALVSFTFGVLPPTAVHALHDADILLVGTATTVAEAQVLAEAGTDIICCQGAEAGAHRGSFLPGAEQELIGTVALVPQVLNQVDVAVIAAGGIMDGRGIAAALALGADAAQLGTVFLRCPEAGTTPAHRQALAAATATSRTVVTDRLTGRAARVIDNRLVRELEGLDPLPYPLMHQLTSELRGTAAREGNSEFTSLWAGQGVSLGRELPAGDLVRWLASDTRRQLARLTDTGDSPRA